jgi:predicted metalloprotease with PDZ domain
MIIDYAHNRLYAIPYPGILRKPFPKDRLGLTLDKQDSGFEVRFVAPHSPAELAGFKVGARITLVSGRSAGDWTETALGDLRYRPSGSNLAFTMEGGILRHVKLADYF